jgi:ATP-dependent DNA helicase RecQ
LGSQEAVIEAVIQGRDSLVLMPTGGGKSLCYQIPSLVIEGTGVIVSPLIALMHEQVFTLKQLGVRAELLNSSLSYEERQRVLANLRAGEVELLYMAPEGLLRNGFLHELRRCPLSLFAIDEAHCVSQWGHDFRPEYLRIAEITSQFPGVPTLALTATADERTREVILEKLELTNPLSFVASFDRPNITYRVELKNSPATQLQRFIKKEHPGASGIVYCLSRQKVEKTADYLSSHGVVAYPYHAGLTHEVREKNQNRFLNHDGIVMVATIAFGMGIDKPDVRFVAHLDMPSSMEAYYQETGRCGRDGDPAMAWMVYGLQDVVLRRQMIENSESSGIFKRAQSQKLNDMLAYCETTSCRRQLILSYFGEVSAQRCGNCDLCFEPVETVDGLVLAQKFISCVIRTGRRFGAGHVIDVLRGKDSEKTKHYGHQGLSTFGIGADLDEFEWKSVLRQLVVHGYLAVEGEYSTLGLTQSSKRLLRGEIEFQIRKELKGRSSKWAKQKKANTTVFSDLSTSQKELSEAIRAWRKTKAKEQGLPAYIIFTDKTLHSLAQIQPRNFEELQSVYGFGSARTESYGEEILNILRVETGS